LVKTTTKRTQAGNDLLKKRGSQISLGIGRFLRGQKISAEPVTKLNCWQLAGQNGIFPWRFVPCLERRERFEKLKKVGRLLKFMASDKQETQWENAKIFGQWREKERGWKTNRRCYRRIYSLVVIVLFVI
jgi:hypothetical protein